MHLSHRTSHNRSVLAVYIHQISLNRAVTGDYAVSGGILRRHVKVGASCLHISSNFNKTVIIK